MYRLYRYNDNEYRILCTKSDTMTNGKKRAENDTFIPQYDEIYETQCLSRAKRMIREYAKCNEFMYFFSSTINGVACDRFSLSECQKKIRYLIKERIRRKDHNVPYIFITEKHDKGGFHFHGLFGDITQYLVLYREEDYDVNTNPLPYYILDLIRQGKKVYHLPFFDELGWNTFLPIEDKVKCSNYITKYITKECVKNENGSVYFCSRGLKRAETYEIMPLDFSKIHKKAFENDFVKILDFDLRSLQADEILYLQSALKDKKTFFDILYEKVF